MQIWWRLQKRCNRACYHEKVIQSVLQLIRVPKSFTRRGQCSLYMLCAICQSQGQDTFVIKTGVQLRNLVSWDRELPSGSEASDMKMNLSSKLQSVCSFRRTSASVPCLLYGNNCISPLLQKSNKVQRYACKDHMYTLIPVACYMTPPYSSMAMYRSVQCRFKRSWYMRCIQNITVNLLIVEIILSCKAVLNH